MASSEEEILVAEIFSPGNFFIQLKHQTMDLEQLMTDLGVMYAEQPMELATPLPAACLTSGSLLAAVWDGDLSWYRVIVVEADGVDHVEVEFVDWGTKCVLHRRRLHPLLPQFEQHPPFAYRARLAGLRPPGPDGTWSRKSKLRFKELVEVSGDETGSLTARILDEKSSKKVELQLTRDGVDVGSTLVAEGHAVLGKAAKVEERTPVSKPALAPESDEHSLTPFVLRSLNRSLVKAGRPQVPGSMDQELQKIKSEILTLDEELSDNGTKKNVADLKAKQKNLTERLIPITMHTLLWNLIRTRTEEEEIDRGQGVDLTRDSGISLTSDISTSSSS